MKSGDLYQSGWEDDWRRRLQDTLEGLGFPDAWHYVRAHPGETYDSLALRLEAVCGVGVAPVQVEHLQAVHTPDSDLHASLRDSLSRFLRAAFKRRGWGEGPYWQSQVAGALALWSTVWENRADLAGFHQRLRDAAPSLGWVPEGANDPYLLLLIPD